MLLALFVPGLALAQPGAAAATNPPAAIRSTGVKCPEPAPDAGPFAGIFVALYPQTGQKSEGGETDDAALAKLFKDLQTASDDPFRVKNWYAIGERPNTGVTLNKFSDLKDNIKPRNEQQCRTKASLECTGAEPVVDPNKLSLCQQKAKKICAPELRQDHFFKEANQKIAKLISEGTVRFADIDKKSFLIVSAYVPLHGNEPVRALYQVFRYDKKELEGRQNMADLPDECTEQLGVKKDGEELKRDFAADDLKKLLGVAVAVAAKDTLSLGSVPVPVFSQPKNTNSQHRPNLPPSTTGPGTGPNPTGPPRPDWVAQPVSVERSVPMKFAVGWLGASVAASGVTLAILAGLNWSGATDMSFGSNCGPMQNTSCVDVRQQLNSGVAVAGVAFGLSAIGLITTLALEHHYAPVKASPQEKPLGEQTPTENSHD